jgi:hypothetical protein
MRQAFLTVGHETPDFQFPTSAGGNIHLYEPLLHLHVVLFFTCGLSRRCNHEIAYDFWGRPFSRKVFTWSGPWRNRGDKLAKRDSRCAIQFSRTASTGRIKQDQTLTLMPLVRNVCVGMAGGIAGSAAMHSFRIFWETAISRDTRDTIFGFNHEADVIAARLVFRLFSNRTLTEHQAGQLGIAMHYWLGATLGIVYKLACCSAGSGALFGALLWLYADEMPISLSGISDPFKKSAASHASALAAHLVFGCVTAQAVQVMQPERSLFWMKYDSKQTEPMLAGIWAGQR